MWVETVGLFLLCFYRVPIALGKSQGRACIPLILHMLLTSRKTTLCMCVCACACEPKNVPFNCAMSPKVTCWQSKQPAECMRSDIHCPVLLSLLCECLIQIVCHCYTLYFQLWRFPAFSEMESCQVWDQWDSWHIGTCCTCNKLCSHADETDHPSCYT